MSTKRAVQAGLGLVLRLSVVGGGEQRVYAYVNQGSPHYCMGTASTGEAFARREFLSSCMILQVFGSAVYDYRRVGVEPMLASTRSS